MRTLDRSVAQRGPAGERAHGHVFVLADPTRAPSRILLEELRARWHEQTPPCLQCDQAGKHYFSELILFNVKR